MPLSPRELEVLRLASYGFTARTAAERLGISEESAKHHRKAIRVKLGVRTMPHAVATGIRRGLFA
jgi:DNA-binding CsgD family transcriptional regulator